MNSEKKENTFPRGTLNGGKLELKRAESALVEHFTWPVLRILKARSQQNLFLRTWG